MVTLADIVDLKTVKISALPETTSVDSDDVSPVVENEITKKVTPPNYIKDVPIDGGNF